MMAAPPRVQASGTLCQTTQSISRAHASALYSNGAIADASPWRNASVIASWPRKPVTATPANTQPSTSMRTVTQCGAAITPAPSATIVVSQNTRASVLSVRCTMRTVIADTAYPAAAASTASPASVNMPVPFGRSTTTTPHKPTTMAIQRARSTRSPRIGTDSMVISSGATKKIA